jgi:hypothetical protein
MEWISVDDQLPPNERDEKGHDREYLVYADGRYWLDCWSEWRDDWGWSEWRGNWGWESHWSDGVTHWMPLPPPPGESDS